MLRPEIPTLAPPAYLLDDNEDGPAGDWHADERHADERPSAA